ncbi:hypothetical protein ACX6XY_22880 [Streptomyces sp. O3]
MLTSTDSTATSEIDGNNSSFNRGTISSTDPNCQPRCLDHGLFSGDFTHCPELDRTHDLVRQFAAMLDARDAAPLPDWLDQLAASPPPGPG